MNYKTYQRIQFPLTPASGKSVWKAEGAIVDRVFVDLSQMVPTTFYFMFLSCIMYPQRFLCESLFFNF